MAGDTTLRSKRELIEKFIQENLPQVEDSEDIPDALEAFWTKERQLALHNLSSEEDLDPERLQSVISEYLYTEKEPMRDNIIGMFNHRPALKERSSAAKRITSRIMDFVETFISGAFAG